MLLLITWRALTIAFIAAGTESTAAVPADVLPITGTVTDERGAPVGRALIQGVWSDWPMENNTRVQVRRETTTTSDGRYLLPLSESDAVFGIRATADGYSWICSSAFAVRCVGPGLFTADFTLRPSCEIAGVVLGPGGEPVTSATITLVIPIEGDAGWLFPQMGTTDQAGRFHFSKIPQGKAFLSIRDPDHVPLNLEVDAPTTTCVITVADRGASLRGRFMFQDGQAVENAAVGLMRTDIEEDAPEIAGPYWWPGTTDEQGNFRFTRLPAGRYQFFLGDPRSTCLPVDPDTTATAVGSPIVLAAKQDLSGLTLKIDNGR